MNPVELEFILTGLQEFVSGIGEANDALKGLKDAAPDSIFETLWDKATSAIGNFAERVWDVASITLGILLRDAIRGAIDLLAELASSAFEAGAELQQVSLRLQGFNMQTLVDAGMEYTEAMTKAVDITKQQLSWVMQLAATTPYDATDIAFVFSMAEAFGYTADESKKLTTNTLDFVAAMGLTGLEAKRVIINLGQMAQRGKITTREMNDLARGSLVPLRDILDRVAKKMNTTTAELTKMIAKPGEGVDYKLFMDAFNEMIETEERFIGAGGRMAHTFKGAMENVWQTLRDLIGNFVLLPAFLDPIGKRVGDMMDTIGEEKNWKAITGAVERIGLTLQGISTQILDAFFPSTARQSIVDRIVSSLDSISSWLKIHQKDIVEFFLGTETWQPFGKTGREGGLFKDIGKIIQDVTKFVGKLVEAFNTISDWVNANKPLIDEFFSSLGDILSEIFTNLTGGVFSKGAGGEAGLAGFLNIVADVMKWIIDNKDKIADFATVILKVWIAFEAGKLVLNTILSFLGLLLQGLLTLLSPMFYVAVVFGLMTFSIWNSISTQKDKVFGFFDDLRTKLNETVTAIQSIDWFQLGKNIILAIADGIGSVAHIIISAMEQIGYNAARGLLQSLGLGALGSLIPSPGGGEETPQTGGGGKEGYKLTALPTVNNATALVSIPTSPSSSVSSSAVVNNYMNLVVNSVAPVESVVQDYAMMQALVG